jgi:hypothetical protein
MRSTRANAVSKSATGRMIHHELFSLEAADYIFGANAFPEKGCCVAQARITGVVARSIVESLKVIEIEHEDAESMFCPHLTARFASQTVFEKTRTNIKRKITIAKPAERAARPERCSIRAGRRVAAMPRQGRAAIPAPTMLLARSPSRFPVVSFWFRNNAI